MKLKGPPTPRWLVRGILSGSRSSVLGIRRWRGRSLGKAQRQFLAFHLACEAGFAARLSSASKRPFGIVCLNRGESHAGVKPTVVRLYLCRGLALHARIATTLPLPLETADPRLGPVPRPWRLA